MRNIRVNFLSKMTQIHNTLVIGKLRIFIVFEDVFQHNRFYKIVFTGRVRKKTVESTVHETSVGESIEQDTAVLVT